MNKLTIHNLLDKEKELVEIILELSDEFEKQQSNALVKGMEHYNKQLIKVRYQAALLLNLYIN